jgi:hypothetical protein
MRRGHHTSRVMKALGTSDPANPSHSTFTENLGTGETLPTEFPHTHGDEEED